LLLLVAHRGLADSSDAQKARGEAVWFLLKGG
jgi:hypothetical protein